MYQNLPCFCRRVVLTGEYWLRDIQDLERHVKESGGGPPGSDAYILNGHPGPPDRKSVV